MTKYDFTRKLAQQFTFKAEALADLGDYLATYSEEDLFRLWNVFEKEYLMVSAPRKGHLIKIAEAAKIFPKNDSDIKVYELLCYFCASQGKVYSFDIGRLTCPSCGCTFSPWLSVGRKGTRLSREWAQSVIDRYPQGAHPTLSTTAKGENRGRKYSPEMFEKTETLGQSGPVHIPSFHGMF